MRYLIEYLTEASGEDSLCQIMASRARTDAEAEADAWRLAAKVQATHQARGFVVRPLFGDEGRIVVKAAIPENRADGAAAFGDHVGVTWLRYCGDIQPIAIA